MNSSNSIATSRRGFLAAAGGLAAAAGIGTVSRAAALAVDAEPFYGAHQGGIATPQQRHTYFAAFDVVSKKSTDLVKLLQLWTEAGARLAAGLTVRDITIDDLVISDDGTAAGLGPARLTVTFGFGATLFDGGKKDRFGLASRQPEALVDLPRFNGDQLEPGRTGGDLSVQVCADDPQVAFHAIRELSRLGYGIVQMRWGQTGFLPGSRPGQTPRNLMGFKDGTINPDPHSQKRVGSAAVPRGFSDVVWVDKEGPAWLRGGSFMVARRIRISLEHWDRTPVDYQEEVVGRHKASGAPLGQTDEFAPLDLAAADRDGNPVIADTAHVRLAAPASHNGAQMFRRGYSYNEATAVTAERWPPWRQGMMFDAGLLFVAYQSDPRTAFIPVFQEMAKMDAMNQFTTHVGSGLFACPPGATEGGFIGQALFDSV